MIYAYQPLSTMHRCYRFVTTKDMMKITNVLLLIYVKLQQVYSLLGVSTTGRKNLAAISGPLSNYNSCSRKITVIIEQVSMICMAGGESMSSTLMES